MNDSNHDFSPREEKIYNAIFNQEINEFSSPIQSIQKSITKETNHNLPSFQEIILHKSVKKNAVSIFTLQKPFYAAAAAILLITGLTWLLFFRETKFDAVAQIAAIKGDSIQLDGKRAQIAPLSSGQKITTGPKNTVDIVLNDGTSLRILENSIVKFKDILIHKEKENITLEMTSGKMLLHIHKKKKNSGFHLLTPLADITVRGTKFLVQASGNNVQIAVLEGRVAVATKQKGTESTLEGEQIIEPMQQINIASGGFKRMPIAKEQLEELETLSSLSMSPVINIATGKTYSSEKEIASEFKRLEKIILTDGTYHTGVIVDMDADTMTIQTIKGEMKIEKNKVLEVEQLQ